MKTNFNAIVRDGISYAKGQIKKLQSEIGKMQKLKTSSSDFKESNIDDIIKWDRKLISDFKVEIDTLKNRL